MNYQLTIDAFIGPWAYSKQFVRNVLASHKGKHVDVKISSLGGNLDHGLDIRQQFIDHGDVTVYLSGFVASAATVIAMGAKRIVMSKYAMFLVHKCSNFIDAWGNYNSDQMQQLINELEENKKENDKIDVVLANMYASKCGKKVSDILNILKEGRWLTAQEALEHGFIDEIAEPDDKESKLNFSDEIGAKFNALGIPTLGLEPDSHFSDGSQAKTGVFESILNAISFHRPGDKPSNNKSSMNEEQPKFDKIASFLKVDSISTDRDNNVTLSAKQIESINNYIEKLEGDAATHNSAIEAKDVEISNLKSQISNLKKAPGAETTEIKDDAASSSGSAYSASELFNSIKSAL